VFEQFLTGLFESQRKEQERLLALDNSLLYHIRRLLTLALKCILPKKLRSLLKGKLSKTADDGNEKLNF
jgi:hypothetical protein